MTKFAIISLIGWLCLATFGCSSQSPDDSQPGAPGSTPLAEEIDVEKTSRTMTPNPPDGAIPADLMERIRDEVARESGVGKADLVTVRAEKVTWRDGSLGCPQPNLMYTQALVEGYWIILRAGREEFDYRATHTGAFARCRSQTKQAPIIYPDNDT